MAQKMFFFLFLLSAFTLAQLDLNLLKSLSQNEFHEFQQQTNITNEITDNSIRDAADAMANTLKLLTSMQEQVKNTFIQNRSNLNSIGGNNFINLESMKSDANFAKLNEALEQMKGMQEKFEKEAIEEAKEFENTDLIAQKLSDGLIATQDSEFFKNEIIKSAQQPDSALRALRNMDISEDIKAGVEKGQEVQGYMSTCMGAFFKNVPPSFCWKKGMDWGVIPNNCPSGYFRSLALCWQYCNPGYTHVLGVCWEQCQGSTDIGLVCYKSFFNWHFKSTYTPDFLTNFNSRIACPEGMYKGGALCYRDCAKNLMVNCGVGACAQSAGACAQGIITMLLEFIAGLAQFVLFVVSFGASSGATPAVTTAKEGLKQGIVQAGKTALKAAFNSFKSWLAGFTKEKIIAWLKKKVIEVVVDKTKTFLIEKACGAVGDYIFEQAQEKTEPTLTMSEKIMSLTEKIPIYGVCSKVASNGSPNDEIACAKNVLETIGMVDPTGICAMAAAFMQPLCDV